MIGRGHLLKQHRRVTIGRGDGITQPPLCCDGGIPTPDDPVHIENKEELDQIIDEHEIVLLEFYADWCGPCEVLAPILERIARDTEAVVVKIDIEENRETTFAHRARSVPTMELYIDGEQAERLVGARSEGEIRELIRTTGTKS